MLKQVLGPNLSLIFILACAATPILVIVQIATASLPELVRFAPDDAFYYLNIARFFSASGMPSFDGVTLTTGFHPLYVGMLVSLIEIFSPSPEGLLKLALILNGTLYLGTLLIGFFIGRILDQKLGPVVMTVALVTSARLGLYSLSGMEASLNVFTVILYIYIFLNWYLPDATKNSTKSIYWGFALGLAGSLVVLARTENAILIFSTLVIALVSSFYSFKRVSLSLFSSLVITGLIVTAALVSWITFCFVTSGDWLQSSATMKQIFRAMETEGMSFNEMAIYSLDHLFNFVSSAVLAVPLIKYLIFGGIFYYSFRSNDCSFDKKLFIGLSLSLPILYGCIFSLTLPGIHSWYLGLSIVLFAVASGSALCFFLNQPIPEKYRRACCWMLCLVALEGPITTLVSLHRSQRSARPETMEFARNFLNKLPEDSVIGSWNSGIFGYFSNRRVINLDGLVNQEIIGAYRDKKMNWPYWIEREMTHIVDDSRWFENIPGCYGGKCLKLLAEQAMPRNRRIVLYTIELAA